jgi:hypothetical protein
MARVAASAHLIDTRLRHADPSMRSYISEMVRIAISQVAFDAIVATLPLGSVAVEPERAENGDVYVWLDHATVAKLRHLRGQGEDFSAVILRLAEATADPSAKQPEKEDDNGLSN